MTSAAVRPLRAEDAGELARLEALVEPTPWTAKDFLDVLKNDWRGRVLEAEDGSVAAWAVVMPNLDEAELLTIGVRPDLQGRGLGRAMLDDVLRLIDAENRVCCHLFYSINLKL